MTVEPLDVPITLSKSPDHLLHGKTTEHIHTILLHLVVVHPSAVTLAIVTNQMHRRMDRP